MLQFSLPTNSVSIIVLNDKNADAVDLQDKLLQEILNSDMSDSFSNMRKQYQSKSHGDNNCYTELIFEFKNANSLKFDSNKYIWGKRLHSTAMLSDLQVHPQFKISTCCT
tara:strand:+ start:174393 stop:174722 length:330 start_codon:yes stop_codon:yes gene_type:complete